MRICLERAVGWALRPGVSGAVMRSSCSVRVAVAGLVGSGQLGEVGVVLPQRGVVVGLGCGRGSFGQQPGGNLGDVVGASAARAAPLRSGRTCGRRRRRSRRTSATAAHSRGSGSCPTPTRSGSTATIPAPGSRRRRRSPGRSAQICDDGWWTHHDGTAQPSMRLTSRACAGRTDGSIEVRSPIAGVMELADMPALGAGARESLRVRVPPPAPMLRTYTCACAVALHMDGATYWQVSSTPRRCWRTARRPCRNLDTARSCRSEP